jgi:hypothetical protein
MMKRILRKCRDRFRSMRDRWQLPSAARAEARRDHAGLPLVDPGPERIIEAGLGWLCRAQDNSAGRDGGVARHYSLVTGWAPSYPETTGYIVPTLLQCAELRGDDSLRQRVLRMLDWLASIQLPAGSFQGGTIGARPVIGVTFNTGQVLLGLAAGVSHFGERFRTPMRRAADWLVNTQDADGCWRKHPTPFAMPGEKAYEPHVAWGLLEAARQDPDRGYAEAALANVDWALRFQLDNGWFAQCCLSDPSQPLTHTLGYVLRGLVEAYRYSRNAPFLHAARRTADGLLGATRSDGFLPGRLDHDWRGTVGWACLTGSAQIAHCWLQLHEATGDVRYRDVAAAANAYVRRTVRVDGPPDTRGAVKGSFPVDGGYGTFEYLSWACKFVIDSNLRELQHGVSAEPTQAR